MHAEGPEFGPQHPYKARHDGLSAERAETAISRDLLATQPSRINEL